MFSRYKLTYAALVLILSLASPAASVAQDTSDVYRNELNSFEGSMEMQPRPLLMAHYMPWYQTPDVSGYWGWHWTMDHFDPAQSELASHYTPLTGPYDSSDEALLEYQVLLMKLSGIDGVIVDWYGTENFRDYAALNTSTGKLFEYIKKAGLRFAICYEDQTVKHMINDGYLAEEDALIRGQEDMSYMQAHWFNDDSYLSYAGQPVLFTFGPQYFKGSTSWEALFSALEPRPALVTLDEHMLSDALSSFPWPPMFGFEVNQAVVEAHLTQFYRKAGRWDYVVGGAFPGFHDIYQEAGVRSSYGYLDAQEGETFRFTLQMALEQDPDVIQLITWNDYGEGTIIEPTEEFGYRYLEIVQDTKRDIDEAGFSFTPDDLRLPLQLFNLRQAYAEDADAQAHLDEAAEAIIAGDLDTAASIIAGY